MSRRTPFICGSSGGLNGVVSVAWPPKESLSSPPGARIFVRVILCLVGLAPFVQGSQASPSASASPFAWSWLESSGQLSVASQTVSASLSGSPVSAGHAALDPVQFSARSHVEAEGRQTVLAGSSASGGHALPTPSQLSATSQMPADERQTAVLFASAGQLFPIPSQVSV